jgi:hypothetical protein
MNGNTKIGAGKWHCHRWPWTCTTPSSFFPNVYICIPRVAGDAFELSSSGNLAGVIYELRFGQAVHFASVASADEAVMPLPAGGRGAALTRSPQQRAIRLTIR